MSARIRLVVEYGPNEFELTRDEDYTLRLEGPDPYAHARRTAAALLDEVIADARALLARQPDAPLPPPPSKEDRP